MTGREVIEHWKQHLQDYPTCSHLMVQRPQLDALIRAMERDESDETLQVMAMLLQEARAAARKYLGPLGDLPRDTREHVLRVHPWLKEE